jgi:hypothetical protein
VAKDRRLFLARGVAAFGASLLGSAMNSSVRSAGVGTANGDSDPAGSQPAAASPGALVLTRFGTQRDEVAPDVSWRGFTDRVMGGVSDAQFRKATVAGRACVRMTGRVTRDRGGGFIQMALDLGGRRGALDANAYDGVELVVYGNEESYNVHLRTPDCGWYDQSYRASFTAAPRWQTVRLPFARFAPNDLTAPLDRGRLQRIALLGWMRDFEADLALAELSLYR